jgi:hypothetical protein
MDGGRGACDMTSAVAFGAHTVAWECDLCKRSVASFGSGEGYNVRRGREKDGGS